MSAHGTAPGAVADRAPADDAAPVPSGFGAVVGRRLRGARDKTVRHVPRSPGAALSVLVLLLVLGWAVAPEWFTHQSPTTGTPAERFRPPSGAHLFGTDQLGRDVYARVVHGASLSLRATVVAIAVALVVGILLGLAAGSFGRWADAVIMRLVEVMLSVPPVLLSLTIVAAIGFGTVQVAVAVGVTSVAAFARVMRAEVLRVRTAGYVEATILLGSRWWRVLFRYVLPAAVGPVLALAALDFGLVVLAIASLSFLGYGEPPPAPEWGALVADGRNYLATAWWLTTLPSLVVTAVVLAANRLSRILENRGERP
ncbi:ABC transporter permease [Streptomyces sp. NPDC046870]|uniref:ABC transporter permease n=1 Tax=Streptomyces sp. NPDC046870 TaxID=3155135 RepID=UPI0034524AEA